MIHFTPFPELETERLLIRQMKKEDAADLLVLRSHPDVLQYISKEPAAGLQEVIEFIEKINANAVANEAIMWGIALKDKPENLIGSICLWHIRHDDFRAELGYSLVPEWWRKGITKEAVQAVIRYAFTQLQLHSIDACIDPRNAGSEAVLISTGFVKEAHFRENFFFRGRFQDTVVYSLLNPAH